MLSLREETSESDAPGFFMSMLTLFKLDQPLSIVGVSKDCVAIYGANEQQEGASLVLYNTRFSVAQSKQFFKVYFNNARFWVIGKHILLAYGQTLACVSFRISKEELADMIGAQRSNELTTAVDRDCYNEEIELEEAFAFDAHEQFVENKIEDSTTECLSSSGGKEWTDLSSVSKTLPTENVDVLNRDLLALYNSGVSVEINRGSMLLSDTVQTKIGHIRDDRPFRVDEVLLMTSEMERCGASEYEITEKCIPLLIAAALPEELATCLRKYTNVSDKMLVRSLKYFLTNTSSPARGDNYNLSDEQMRFVNVVLSCTFNEELIKEPLRSLDFNEVLSLLSHLYAMLASNSEWLRDAVQLGADFDEDSHLQRWFSAILDAHYQSFILSRNAKLPTMMRKWKQLIDRQATAVREMKTVSALVYNLVGGKAITRDRQSSKWYSVEAVKLY